MKRQNNYLNNYDYIALLNLTSPGGNSATAPIFGPDASPAYGQLITQKNVVDINRTWEKIKTTNIGLDFSVLDQRLNGSFDYFVKKNNNMLSEITYPAVYGATAPKTNSGKMEVKGWEITLSWRDKIGNVSYYVSGNISDSKNKLIMKENAITKTWNARTSYLEGYAIDTYWGLAADRLITNETELNAYRQIVGSDLIDPAKLSVGDMIYKDIDGDGKVTRTDVKLLGDNTPHYSFGLNLGAEWKGFDCSMIIQGVGKQAIMRNRSAATMLIANTYQNQGALWYGKSWSDIGEKLGSNYPIQYIDKDGNTINSALKLPQVNKDPNAVPRSTTDGSVREYNYYNSDAFYRLQNGAYARMKNITIGYTFPKNLLSKVNISNLRVYFSGNDLFEITKTKDGWDSEATAEDPFGGTNGSNGYPFMRSFSFGIDLTF